MLTVQRMKHSYSSPIETAIGYFSILAAINHLPLSEREIQLIAFMSIKGSISSGGAKEQFIQMFGSSRAYVGNMMHKLTKQGYIVYEKGKAYLHPQLRTDCSSGITLQIQLSHE